jgi:hypothetical protein
MRLSTRGRKLRDAALTIVSPVDQSDDAKQQAAFRLLRANAPVYWLDCPDVEPFWAVTSHSALTAAERRGAPFAAGPRTILSTRTVDSHLRQVAGRREIVRGITHMDEPDHSAYRAIAQPWFLPAAVAEHEGWIADWAHEIVDRIAGRETPFDFAAEVAAPFTLRVFMRVMGLPEADEPLVLKLARGLLSPEDPVRGLSDHPPESVRLAGVGFRDYFSPMVADRQTCPRHDLTSAIANASVHGLPIPPYERLSYYMLLATAGHDTTAYAMTGGLHALATHPEQMDRLRHEPALLPSAIEEILRWTSPVRHFLRTATADTELAGQPIKAGECVALLFAAANRDPAVFADPDMFRIDRSPNPHLAFGLGPHFCLGLHLARLELRSLYAALLPRLASVDLAGPVERTQSAFITGIASLPVRCRWRDPD